MSSSSSNGTDNSTVRSVLFLEKIVFTKENLPTECLSNNALLTKSSNNIKLNIHSVVNNI